MDDLISRQKAIDAINEHLELVTIGLGNDREVKEIYKMAYNHVIDAISILPTIQPEQRKAHWIHVDLLWFRCSECDAHMEIRCGRFESYCPNCGARMEVEQ